MELARPSQGDKRGPRLDVGWRERLPGEQGLHSPQGDAEQEQSSRELHGILVSTGSILGPAGPAQQTSLESPEPPSVVELRPVLVEVPHYSLDQVSEG